MRSYIPLYDREPEQDTQEIEVLPPRRSPKKYALVCLSWSYIVGVLAVVSVSLGWHYIAAFLVVGVVVLQVASVFCLLCVNEREE